LAQLNLLSVLHQSYYLKTGEKRRLKSVLAQKRGDCLFAFGVNGHFDESESALLP